MIRVLAACAAFVVATQLGAAVRAAEPIDPAQAVKEDGSPLLWYDFKLLHVEGKGFNDTLSFYDRLPGRVEKVVRAPVWGLSRNSTGISARFVTNASSLDVRWTLTSDRLAMTHMPATGVSGLDLYVRQPNGSWRWLAVGQPKAKATTQKLFSGLASEDREFLLYLPLYNGVTDVALGLPAGAKLAPADPYPAAQAKPIVFYGTSITQGGCASRPGMVHTSIVGRALNWPVINLGFSGNGRLDPELAPLLGEIDAAVYVLDCLPNLAGKDVTERAEPFVKKLRELRPATPILLVEDRFYPDGILNAGKKQRNDENHAALQAAYQRLKEAGVTGLYYLPGENLLSPDGEGTVDGSHPTDLGFFQQAQAFLTVLRPILKK